MDSSRVGNRNDKRGNSERPPLGTKRQKTKQEQQLLVSDQLKSMQQEKERLEQEKERLEQENKRLQQEVQEQGKEIQLNNGIYFTTIQQLWCTKIGRSLNESGEEYKLLTQGRPKRNFKKQGGIYTCRHHEEQMCNLPEKNGDLITIVKSNHNRTSMASGDKNAIWPKNIVNGDIEETQVAHLLPHGYSKAATYWFLPPWLYPDTEEWTWDKRMKVLVGGRQEDGEKRQKFTGILHSVCNKARICGQAECMDSKPCLIIVPILPLDKVVNWKDEGYEAIMVIGTVNGMNSSGRIAQLTNMNVSTDIQFAANDEIIQATNLLRFFLQAIFTATRNVPDATPDANAESIDEARQKCIIEEAERVSKLNEVILPVLQKTNEAFKVRKVKFEQNAGPSNGHPAPDPMLLVMKACAVFSRRNEEKIVANSEPKEDNWDEMDYIALDNFIEYHQQQLKPSSDWDILAKQLGQPGASRPENWNEGVVGPRDLKCV